MKQYASSELRNNVGGLLAPALGGQCHRLIHHKAQGGEWHDVFLFLEKSMYAMHFEELLRWWYTAVTRAKNQLNLASDWWIV